jgi:flagellar hook-associated protein 1 FlgK
MGLSQALASAMSGLRANQIALGLVSSNVANAETPGYIKKTSNQVAVTSGEFGSSVRVAGVNRELDIYLQRQLRTEISGAAYAGVRAEVLDQLQAVYGTPGSAGTLESTFNSLTTAVQALSTSSDSQSARIAVVNAAQALVQQLNTMTRGIQSLRANAEAGLSGAVNIANNAMQQIANINVQILRGGQTDGAAAELLDQRDRYLNQLSELMDVRVITNEDGQVNVFTTSGVQLVGAEASRFSFDQQGTVTPNTLWSSNPAESNLGSITVNFPHGGSMDLFAANTFRSGQIAALVELRDHTLVQAQTQLDEFAAALSSALSDLTVAGTAATSGLQTGFSVDLAGMQPGNAISLTYTNPITNVTSQVSIVRVDDPSVLPLPNNATNDPNDQVIGIDFSAGMASVVSQLNAALGSSANLSFSNTGSVLTVLDDGAGGLSDVDALSATSTPSSLQGGVAQVALFKDGGNLYTGAQLATGAQVQGFAGRITVNSAIKNDPSTLVKFTTTTPAGDTTRPDFIYSQLTSGSYFYSPSAGLGTANAPFKGTLLSFAQQFTSAQGESASAAKMLSEGQRVVLSTLQQKFASTSGVNIDDEMAHLLALQNAYAANARVMGVVKEMYQALMQVL